MTNVKNESESLPVSILPSASYDTTIVTTMSTDDNVVKDSNSSSHDVLTVAAVSNDDNQQEEKMNITIDENMNMEDAISTATKVALDSYTFPDTSATAIAATTTSTTAAAVSAAAAVVITTPTKPYAFNAVHMEIQENAKIPNLYQIPVNRTRTTGENAVMEEEEGGGGEGGGGGLDNQDVMGDDGFFDEIMRLTEEDWNLTENFLGSDERSSASAAYCNAGALLSAIGSKVDGMNQADNNSNNDNDMATNNSQSDGATTEISTQINSNVSTTVNDPMNQVTQGINQQASSATTIASTANAINTNPSQQINNNNMSLYGYGRSIPLPIPKISNSPTHRKSATLTDTSSTNTTTADPTVSTTISSSTYPYSSISPSNQLVSSTAPNEATALAAALTTPALMEAAMKRSQFGFGGNHVVPSVPIPPKKSSVIPKSTSIKSITAKATASAVPSSTTTTTTTTPPKRKGGAKKKRGTVTTATTATTITTIAKTALSGKSSTNEGPSYERKKQRAKDARVRLNESIDRLAVAIDLAGTQSKQRAEMHSRLDVNDSRSTTAQVISPPPVAGAAVLPTPSLSTTTSMPIPTTGEKLTVFLNTTKSMEHVHKTADSAKMWDRPSFVGTAATLIQGLNAQCESLMNELLHLTAEREQWKEDLKKAELINAAHAKSCNITSSYISFDTCSNDDGLDDHPDAPKSKKRKLSNDLLSGFNRADDIVVTSIDSIVTHEHILSSITLYLDPRSTLRCISVSRLWQLHLKSFINDDHWFHLCVQRFGISSVRIWQQNNNQEPDEAMIPTSLSAATTVNSNDSFLLRNSMNMYRDMNIAGVKPKSLYEGNITLGGGCIPNMVCAWVSTIDRSNGETARTVLCHNGMNSDNGSTSTYSSLHVVELRILIQNVGVAEAPIFIPEQIISIDASTKRRGEEFFELRSDARLTKKFMTLDGSPAPTISINNENPYCGIGNIFQLKLYESVIMSVFIHAQACPTTTKFQQKAKFAKVLVNVRGTTLPLVVPFKP